MAKTREYRFWKIGISLISLGTMAAEMQQGENGPDTEIVGLAGGLGGVASRSEDWTGPITSGVSVTVVVLLNAAVFRHCHSSCY